CPRPSNSPPSLSARGTLFVVATPIGNLEDVSARALRVLREVDLIACEDTRRTRALLSHFDIHTPTVSYFEHNKLARGPQLLRRLTAGASVALVTDAAPHRRRAGGDRRGLRRDRDRRRAGADEAVRGDRDGGAGRPPRATARQRAARGVRGGDSACVRRRILHGSMTVPKALTIAGSDSGGGAGIQADLKTFSAFEVFGMSAVTAVTAQNSLGVLGVLDLPPEFVGRQIDAVLEDLGADAIKTGMLATKDIVGTVAGRLRAHRGAPVVVDPVMIASSGDPLLQPGARDVLVRELLPLATLVTPNLMEAGVLADMAVDSEADLTEAARRIGA